MDCCNIEFSSEKSHERINKALQVFPHKVLMCILGFALHLLGAKRKIAAELVGIPQESLKTAVSRIYRDGFSALRDRRHSVTPAVARSPACQQITVQQNNEGWLIEFGSNGNKLTIPGNHRVHARTIILSLHNAGVLSLSQSALALGICDAHCRELSRKLTDHDVADVLIDKREGQKQDYRVGTEQKAELIKQLVARIITGHSTSSEVLAEQVNKQTGAQVSARTIRWHIHHLGLCGIRKSLPQLVETLKKTPEDCG